MIPIRTAFFDTHGYEAPFFDPPAQQAHIEIKYLTPRLSVDTLALVGGHDAVCVFTNDNLSRATIDGLLENGIRLIALRCAGYNNVDLQAAYGRLHVVRVPAYSPHAVAEHTLALIMALNRKTHKAYYRTRDNNFRINGLMGFDLYGKTAGIVGTGVIGLETIKILRGLGMKVLAYDPYPITEQADSIGFDYVMLDELLARSDVVSLHCPLTPQNVYLINAASLAKMKDGVMIINTGRGKLIDTVALIEAIKSGKVGAAGLDVYEEETDYFFEDFSDSVIDDDVLARLLTMPNVLVTSHQAFFTREAVQNIAETTIRNIDTFFRQDALPNEICYKCCHNGCQRKITGRCF